MNLFRLLVKPDLYLDPGSGSMLIQIIIAALLGAGVAIRVFWKNIKAFFTGKKTSDIYAEDPTLVLDDDPTAVPLESTSTKE
jgi:hypothetical protein